MALPHGRPPDGDSNKANSRDSYCTGSYGRTSSYEKVVEEVNATRTLEGKNAVPTSKSVKTGNGKTQKERRSRNSRGNPTQDTGRPDRVLLHKNAKNEKEEISNCHLPNLCDSAAKSLEKMIERNIEAEEQSKALGILAEEVQNQTERMLLNFTSKFNYTENELLSNQFNIEAESHLLQAKPDKSFSETPPSKNTLVARKIQSAVKLTSPFAAATPENRARSTAALLHTFGSNIKRYSYLAPLPL